MSSFTSTVNSPGWPFCCFYETDSHLVVAVINILIDVWILAMPIRTLKNIKRPTRDKVMLFIVFGVASFSCISRFVRTLHPLLHCLLNSHATVLASFGSTPSESLPIPKIHSTTAFRSTSGPWWKSTLPSSVPRSQVSVPPGCPLPSTDHAPFL